MDKCKFCHSSNLVKYGFTSLDKQKYLCKDCNKVISQGDKRAKYSNEAKLKVLRMYLEGMGIRSIERLENIPNPLIIKWIRQFGQIVENTLRQQEVPKDLKEIEILEIDELVTHVKKNEIKSGFGLLLTDQQIKLLIWK